MLLAALSVTSARAQSTAGPSSNVTIYVSPSGSDTNAGTSATPLHTLTKAQQVVRTLNQNMISNITVSLGPGTYRLSQALRFGPVDSGSNGYDVDLDRHAGSNRGRERWGSILGGV